MTTLKKAMFTALAAAILSTAGISASTTSASAGYHYSGGYHFPKCGWKVVRWKDYYGWHSKRKWVCG